MRVATVESWVEAPLERFIEEARARFAVLLMPSGQVVAQAGFTRSVDVMTACALGAAINASSRALGRQVDGQPFRDLYHAGLSRQVYLAEADARGTAFVLLAVFDSESSIGLVRLFFEQLQRDLAAAAPARRTDLPPLFAGDFEGELRSSLDALFRSGDAVHR